MNPNGAEWFHPHTLIHEHPDQPDVQPRKVDVFEGLDPKVRERTKKMLMYFILFAVVMLFAGFTSAYIVSNVGQYWVHIEGPAPSGSATP